MDTPTPNIPTFQELVESGLKKFDIVVPAIEELKKNYLPLKIKSVDDKDGYEKVSKALRFMISKRNEVEEKRKELKADSLAYGKAVDNRAKEITFLLTPIEEYLRLEKERIDDEIEAIKEKKIREEQERLNIRNRRLLQAGMKLVGNEYFWQNPNDLAQVEILPSVNLETLDDLSFDEYIDKINLMAKEQQEIFEKEQKKLSQEREKLEQEQKKFREEMEMMKLQRTKMRLESLYQIGLVSITHLNSVCYKLGDEYVGVISYPEVVNSENWEETLSSVTSAIYSIKEKAAAKEFEEQQKIKEAEEKAIQKIKEEKELEEKMEAERISQLSDKEKFQFYVQKLLRIEPPILKTAKWKKEIAGLRGLIENYE
jgi:hypothetical protein